MFIIYILLILVLIYLVKNTNKINMGTYTPYTNYISIDLLDNTKSCKGYIGIIRHGTRYPTKNVYDQSTPSLKKNLDENLIGELHIKGKLEMIEYGKYLKSYYPNIFKNRNNYIIYSTQMSRAIDSAKYAMGDNYIERGIEVDKFLKLKHVLKSRPDYNPEVISCQFMKALDLPIDNKCNTLDYTLKDKNIHTWETIMNTKDKGLAMLSKLKLDLETITKTNQNTGFLYFCHDSTLAPLYALLDILPNKYEYRNEDWIPFSARLEILVDYNNNINYYVNGRKVYPKNKIF
jgi:hypothetical protein